MHEETTMKDFQLQRSSAYAFLLVSTLVVLNGCYGDRPRWSETESGIIRTVTNRGGQTLRYVTTSGVSLLTVERFAFKDLNRNGALDPYEDWRLSASERAKDLASKMSVEQIAGLMLYSAHQAIPGAGGWFRGTYGGKPFAESGANAWDLSDDQKDFLTNDDLRHVLITTVASPEVAARWNNNVQALVEGIGLGIPANNSSDPRHEARAIAEYNAGSEGTSPGGRTRSVSPRRSTPPSCGSSATSRHWSIGPSASRRRCRHRLTWPPN